jgi:rhodanese-related sulfurtransferase
MMEAQVFERLFGGATRMASVSPREAWDALSQDKTTHVLIDVRESWEYNRGHAKGARNIPLSQLGRRLGEIPRDRQVLVICQSGHRSMVAARMLLQHDFAQVTNVSGGTMVWHMHGLPTEGGKR